MIERILLLSYLASIYPIGTRFSAYLIVRQKRHHMRDHPYDRNVYGGDRDLSIMAGYLSALIWPLSLVGWGIYHAAAPAARAIVKVTGGSIDDHVERIESRHQETLGKLGQREHA